MCAIIRQSFNRRHTDGKPVFFYNASAIFNGSIAAGPTGCRRGPRHDCYRRGCKKQKNLFHFGRFRLYLQYTK